MGEGAVERRTDERAGRGYVATVIGALGGAAVGGAVGAAILALVLEGQSIGGDSLDSLMDTVAWGIFLVLIVLPTVCFVIAGGGTYLALRLAGHRAPLRTALYTVILAVPCVFVAGKVTDGLVSLIFALVAAALIGRRLALGSH
jgi:hypothetical protein